MGRGGDVKVILHSVYDEITLNSRELLPYNWYLSMGMRRNSIFLNRLSRQAKHSKIDLLTFLSHHHQQYGYFKHASFPTLFLYQVTQK